MDIRYREKQADPQLDQYDPIMQQINQVKWVGLSYRVTQKNLSSVWKAVKSQSLKGYKSINCGLIFKIKDSFR